MPFRRVPGRPADHSGISYTSCDVPFLLDGQARVSVYSSQGKQVSFCESAGRHFRRDGRRSTASRASASIEAISDFRAAAVLPQAAFIATLAASGADVAALRHLTARSGR